MTVETNRIFGRLCFNKLEQTSKISAFRRAVSVMVINRESKRKPKNSKFCVGTRTDFLLIDVKS